ncbi:hypothetical protein GOARA_042_00250 [Gordonia araii NBRC 100433]|uniref:Uncharacterized protein n=1 Tax=Gordonia araii NBRC 100433 TaxID=1073574 RepID=G7H0Z3_9ACTN|nr:hypothetical protein [Gordonia araii]NNG97311.1 hypothetical protein [Gordonia araii NBRC 100433]GAB09518.1 hypothetical protein GOARA_042_00250 [Gordonia araii NBRC 100433]
MNKKDFTHHFGEAERLLDQAESPNTPESARAEIVDKANVHAQLATAAAVALRAGL